MKIALLSVDGVGYPIAYHLQQEGHEVYVGQVRDWQSVKVDCKEKPKDRDARLNLYDALLKNRWPIERLMSFLLGQRQKEDWIVLCDFNWLWPYADRLRKAGFRGLLPHKEDYQLEHDRKQAHDLITELYPDIEESEYHEFKTTKDGIKFLESEDEKLYVLKGFNSDAETVVPIADDVDDNRALLIDALERDPDHNYEKDGYILEEKIEDAIEFTPEAVAFDGELRSVSVDIEHKRLGSRSGPMTGCALGAIFWQELDATVYDMFLAPLAERMLRPNEITVWDLSVFYSPSRKKFYAGEFCSNRMGYDAVFGEICTYSSTSDWLKAILGEEKERMPVSASMRVFNLDKKQNLFIGDPADPNVWCFDIHQEKDKIYASGYDKNTFVVTAPGNQIYAAIKSLYEVEQGIEFNGGYFLQSTDWFDEKYHENILNRVQILTKLDLLQEGDNYGNQNRRQTIGARAGS